MDISMRAALIKCFIVSCALGSSYIVQANFLQDFYKATKGHYDVGLGLGATQNSIGQSTLIPAPVAELEPQKFVTNSNSSLSEYNLQAGYDFLLAKKWSLRLDIGYYFSNKQSLHGDYYTIPTPPADQTYNFKLSTQALMATTQFNYQLTPVWSVFGGLALGQIKLKTSALQFTVIPESTSGSNALTSKAQTLTRFGYRLSAGATYQIKADWRLKAGLAYLPLGHVDVPTNDASNNSSLPTNVSLGQLNPWQVFVSAFYQF
jgi:opacity protein-like surface antigen